MSKDSNDCEVMNELFDSREKPLVHCHLVAWYYDDNTKIRDLSKEEQLEWIKKQIQNKRRER